MIYYKTPSGEVFAYSTQAERDKWGGPDLVPMTDAEVQAHLAPAPRNIAAEIAALEQSTMLPRVTREFMLTFMELEAAKQGIDVPTLKLLNVGYARVKELDEQIAALRGLL